MSPETTGWHAHLDLAFERRDERTLLTRRLHRGPLQVQKALYPEGPRICHVTVLHPPGGVASGDSLSVRARLEPQSMVCLTTPGAIKWYRCPEAWAEQRLSFHVAENASLEWLPRENIFFDDSRSRLVQDIELSAGAAFFGWEILCFGRRASQERWRTGALQLTSTVRLAGRLLWSERADIRADSGFGASAVGLAGFSVSATFVVAGPHCAPALLAACRGVAPTDADSRYGMTVLPAVLVVRYLGHSSEDAFNWFTSLWNLLRPAHRQIAATRPRLWAC